MISQKVTGGCGLALEAFTSDSSEAWKAWTVYSAKRFYSREVGSWAWFEAYEAFVVEFLMCRGWRRIPGSKEWV